jgi:hypothetical protein
MLYNHVLVATIVKIDGVRQKPDIMQLFRKEAVDILLVFENEFPQVGINFFMMGSTELVQDDTGDQQHGVTEITMTSNTMLRLSDR